MKRTIHTLLCLTLLCAAPPGLGRDTGLTVAKAWIAEAPPGTGVNAGYLTINNSGDRERFLERISSSAFKRVEMHRTVVSGDGSTGMRRQEQIAIAAGTVFEFSPGGYHLMLFENREPVRSGGRIDLTLHFADGTVLETGAIVRRPGGHHHH